MSDLCLNLNELNEEIFDESMLSYIVDNFVDARIFGGFIAKYMTKDLWKKAYERNCEVVRYIPVKYYTSEMIDSICTLDNFDINYNNYTKITKDMFKKIYSHYDKEKKLSVFPPFSWNRIHIRQYEKNVQEKIIQFIDSEIAEELLSIDISTIWQIPKQFISKDRAFEAMETNIYFLVFVPSIYQTQYYQDKFIEKYPMEINAISEDILTISTIKKALSLRLDAFTKLPEKFKTKEIIDYVNSIDSSYLSGDTNNESDYTNIRLESIKGLLNNRILTILSQNGIVTVGDLLNRFEEINLKKSLFPIEGVQYRDLGKAIMLLKCKYLGVNPEIRFNDTDREFFNSLGFSNEIIKNLLRGGVTKDNFFKLFSDNNFENNILQIRFIGKSGLKEIRCKLPIVLSYFKTNNNLLGIEVSEEDSNNFLKLCQKGIRRN